MERDKFKDDAKKMVDDIFNKIDEMEMKKDKVKDSAKERYMNQVAELKTKKNELKKSYENLLETTEGNWDDAKKSFTQSTNHFKKGLQELITY